MFIKQTVDIEWGGRPLRLETGRIARQADGAVLATYGATSVLATIVAAKEEKPGIDFFPLTVNYQEKTFAAGKIPGGYFKREGRPTEKETLTSRLIDRPIRPLFAPGFKNETQVIATVLSHDMENDPDIVAMIASSAALTLSGVPFLGPISAARVGYIEGQYVLNPMIDEMSVSSLDLVVAGTADAVLMVESEAKELSEEVMLGAVVFGQKQFQPVLDAIVKLAERAAKEPWELKPKDNAEVLSSVRSAAEAGCARPMPSPPSMSAATASPRSRTRCSPLSFPPMTTGRELPRPLRPSRRPRKRSCARAFSRRRDASTAAIWRQYGRSCARSASCPAPMAVLSSPAARRKRLSSPRSAPGRTSNMSTLSRGPTKRLFCCTTTSRLIRSARLAA